MTLGYCPACGGLVTIRKGPIWLPGQREAWYVGEHEGPDGKRCTGKGRPV